MFQKEAPLFKCAVCVPQRGTSFPFVYRYVRSIKALPFLRWDRSFVMSRENVVIYNTKYHEFCWTITKQRTGNEVCWLFGRVTEYLKCPRNVTQK